MAGGYLVEEVPHFMNSLRAGYPEYGDVRLAPGLYWARGAQGRLEGDVATALAFAYLHALRRAGGHFFPPIIITQGAFSKTTPGQAHDAGGAVDLRSRHMTPTERERLISALTHYGFAVHDLGWPTHGPHIHAIFVHSATLNRAAKAQIASAPRRPEAST